jgi:hypothetical protein
MSDSDHEQRLIGSFDVGAYGPTIFMVLPSREAVVWLKALFLSMTGYDGSRDLLSEPGVEVRGIERFELRRTSADSERHLLRQGDAAAFVWSATDDVWRRNSELLDPFVDGQSGHQYLTSEGVDDALVEISFGEPDVMPWGRQ